MRVSRLGATAWETDFVVELRLLGVDGRRIGAALEEVRSHCAESGQEVQEAFGDPGAYARGLALPVQQDASFAAVLGAGAGVVGMLLAVWSFTAWLEGERFTVTVGSAVVVGVLALLGPLLLRQARPVLTHPGRTAGLGVLLIGGLVAASLLLTTPLADVSALAGTATGLALVAGATIWDRRRPAADPVVTPMGAASGGRAGAVLATVNAWFVPVATVVLLAATWALDATR